MEIGHVRCGEAPGGGESHGGDHDEQVRDVRHAVHQVGRDAVQVLVGEVARREYVHGV